MPTRQPQPESQVRAAISVIEMMSLLGLKPSRFYELIRLGKLPGPCYHIETRRPLYLADQVEACQRIKATHVALDGSYILFYKPRSAGTRPKARKEADLPRAEPNPSDQDRLVEGLRSLGVTATPAEVAIAVKAVYPLGTRQVHEGEVLRGVFRHIRQTRAS